MLNKRSLSPLIATILLIVVSVILITVVLTWGKGFTESTINNTDLFTSFTEDVDLKNFILVDSFIQTPTKNNLVLKNSSDKNITIVGYSLHSVDSNYVFLEKKFYLDNTLNLTNGSVSSLSLVCAPSSRFSVQLITDQNTFVEIPIFTNNLDPNNYCLGKNDLVGYWKLDGDLKDYSGNNNQGTNYGATFVSDVPFGEGNSLSFDGASYINLGNNSIFDITDQITLSIWVNMNGYTDYDTFFWKTYTGNSGNQSNYGLSMTSSQRGRFAVGGKLSISSQVFPIDTWIHMTGTYDGNYLKLYRDATLAATPLANTDPITVSIQDLTIGRRKYGSTFKYPANALIREVQIYNRALTSKEVRLLYTMR